MSDTQRVRQIEEGSREAQELTAEEAAQVQGGARCLPQPTVSEIVVTKPTDVSSVN